jgi:hypothetical protein
MATKKQRRRRDKLQRHDYEYVVEGEEGEQVVVPSARPKRPATTTGGKPVPQGAVVDARGRIVQPPSWRRVGKRVAIFGPIMVIVVLLLGGDNVTTTAKIVNAAFLIAIFVPFSYFTDRLIYRQVLKRQQRAGR